MTADKPIKQNLLTYCIVNYNYLTVRFDLAVIFNYLAICYT